MPTHHYYFPMASLKNKKYSYRKETRFLLFAGAITVALKYNPREAFEKVLGLISPVR